MICTIRWLDHSNTIWEEHFQNVKESNLLQLKSYGLAMEKLKRQKPRQATLEIDGRQAGLVQILEAGMLNNMIHAVILDRGPLWLDGYGSEEHFQSFVQAFRHEFPRRFGRRVRFIPEMPENEAVKRIMKDAAFRRRGAGYQTLWLDLEFEEADLRAGLAKNWRNALSKAEKQGMEIEWDESGEHFEWLMKCYTLDRKTKGYDGPSVELLRTLAGVMLKGDMAIGRALKNGHAVGAILLFCHGRSSTYQIGWNGQEGRALGAHNLLLWQALLYLRGRGISAFDLGGVNEGQAHAVKKFKEGLGGRLCTLAGLYT